MDGGGTGVPCLRAKEGSERAARGPCADRLARAPLGTGPPAGQPRPPPPRRRSRVASDRWAGTRSPGPGGREARAPPGSYRPADVGRREPPGSRRPRGRRRRSGKGEPGSPSGVPGSKSSSRRTGYDTFPAGAGSGTREARGRAIKHRRALAGLSGAIGGNRETPAWQGRKRNRKPVALSWRSRTRPAPRRPGSRGASRRHGSGSDGSAPA